MRGETRSFSLKSYVTTPNDSNYDLSMKRLESIAMNDSFNDSMSIGISSNSSSFGGDSSKKWNPSSSYPSSQRGADST